MHIFNMNILQTVKDKISIIIPYSTSNMTLHTDFRLAYLDLILAHSQGQCQGHAYFDY